jgi:hypothetical protein
MVKLETLLALILLERTKKLLTEGLGQSNNKKMQKRKMKKKEQKLLQNLQESIKREKDIKKDKEEAERQRIMYILAESKK